MQDERPAVHGFLKGSLAYASGFCNLIRDLHCLHRSTHVVYSHDVRSLEDRSGHSRQGSIEALVHGSVFAIAGQRAADERLSRRSRKQRKAQLVQISQASQQG